VQLDVTIDSSTAHLVAGVVADDKTANLVSRHVASLMNQLAKGEYALTVSRGMGQPRFIAPFGSRPTLTCSPLPSRRW
jgi:hypothetical protein